MKKNDTYKIDSYNVKQYENMRIVDIVTLIETPKKYSKLILVYSPLLRANILVKRNELK